MKHVVSVSLGSSLRNHSVVTKIMDEEFKIERIGTDGDLKKAVKMIKELDGKVDAIGLGGIDLYICAGKRRYILRDAAILAKAAKKTPVVDGSGLKNTLERRVIQYLDKEYGFNFKDKKVLLVSGVDRFGMAESLSETGCDLILGDLIFALGIPVPIRSLKTLDLLARIIAPIVSKLPFKLLYPTGEKQQEIIPKYSRFYHEADVIAGDFHFIKRYLPLVLNNKTIITNTVTSDDIKLLKERGVKMLVTTTPNLNGRSFGTNVMEGVLVALLAKDPKEITPEDFSKILDEINFKPRIEVLNEKMTP